MLAGGVLVGTATVTTGPPALRECGAPCDLSSSHSFWNALILLSHRVLRLTASATTMAFSTLPSLPGVGSLCGGAAHAGSSRCARFLAAGSPDV